MCYLKNKIKKKKRRRGIYMIFQTEGEREGEKKTDTSFLGLGKLCTEVINKQSSAKHGDFAYRSST